MSDIAVIAQPGFEPFNERHLSARAGSTLAEMIALAMPGATLQQLGRAVVTLVTERGEWVVDRINWYRVFPRPGTMVRVRAVVGGGNVLRSVLSIAVLAAATIFLGPAGAIAGGVAGALGISAAAASAGLIAVASTAGALLINALVPLDKKDDSQPEQRYTINGTRNMANPWGPIPEVLGTMRVYPPLLTGQYSEPVGDDVFLRAGFLCGRNGHIFGDWRLGETALTPTDGTRTFGGVEIELKTGWDTDTPLTLVEECVFEDTFNIVLKAVDDPTIRRTATKTDAVSVDLAFNSGLVAVDADDGDKHALLVQVDIRYRKIDEEGGPPGSWTDPGSMVVIEQKNEPFRRSMRWELPEPGLYDIRLQRITVDQDGNDGVYDEVNWATLRSIRHQYPVDYPEPLALVALRIKASKQLSGIIDEFNLMVGKVIPDWDPIAEEWVDIPTVDDEPYATSNPASIYRYLLTGSDTALARSTDELDLEAIQEWHEWCEEKGLTYNRFHDFDQPMRETLAQVCAAGRAAPTQAGGKWSVVIDRPQTIIRGHITQRNAWGFSGEMSYRKLPDAFRVRFQDENDNYRAREIIVVRPGFVGEPELFEQIEFPGYTSYALNYREARRRFAELELRAETFYCSQDFEHLFAPRGSLVMYAHPVLSSIMRSGRVKEVGTMTDGSDRTYVVLDERVIMVDGQDYACRFRHSDGTSSLFSVDTVAGETDTLYLGALLDGVDALPEVDDEGNGDLAMFGLEGSESIECIVKAIEPMKNLAARLTLVRHAPTIESIADDGEIPTDTPEPTDPPWVARDPAVPEIYSVRSGPDELILDEPGAQLVVYVRQGEGSVPVHHYVVTAQRGAETPIDITAPVSSGRAIFDDFDVGDSISITATAVSAYSLESDPTDPVVHVIKARTDLPADIATLSFLELVDGTRHYAWTLDPAATAAQVARIAGYVIKAAPGTGLAWGDLDRINEAQPTASPLESVYPVTSGAHTIGVASIDYRGRICANPALIDVTMGLSPAAMRGGFDLTKPTNLIYF